MGVEETSATRLLDKLAAFAAELDDDERQLLAALLAPGVAKVWHDEDEVTGFGVDWLPGAMPAALESAVRGRELRIEGL